MVDELKRFWANKNFLFLRDIGIEVHRGSKR